MISLEDSFIENERRAGDMTKQEKDKELLSKAFSDDRVPTSLQGRMTAHSAYKKQDFDIELDERPTRERPSR